ncbi:MAG: alpha-glucan family phosphorylase [Planctomycetota bacterium]|nr:alpha-glucan family phosphorylase [Planctomycetota bacterium]
MTSPAREIAYFTMEIGIDPNVPTYSGGLGMLAGDCIRSAADLGLPLVTVSLLHRKGYFFQKLDTHGNQTEEPTAWIVEDYLTRETPRTAVTIEGRTVHIAIWRFDVSGIGGTVPVYFLDTDLEENHPDDRNLTDELYGRDAEYRLRQEIVLGIGGVRALRALGHSKLHVMHMNEGHPALLILERAAEHAASRGVDPTDDAVTAAVRHDCAFTTHTPVAAGHDCFPLGLVRRFLGDQPLLRDGLPYTSDGVLNLSKLALHYCGYSNAVSVRHRDVSRAMFPGYDIDAITNGVHAPSWVAPPIAKLLDEHCPDWRRDERHLRLALRIPAAAIRGAHAQAKRKLIQHVNNEYNAGLDVENFTIAFARRATPYKRATMLFHDLDRLAGICRQHGPVQFIFAGKAHPRDGAGKDLIRTIMSSLDKLKGVARGVYLPNYDFDLCRRMVAGVDLWLNNPLPPLEASGTSGMKAALNGVPSLSTLDGWWLEGCVEGVTGWAIGDDRYHAGVDAHVVDDRNADSASLYQKLELHILPTYYQRPDDWARIMLHSIAINGSYFNTQRVMLRYLSRAYRRTPMGTAV